LLTAPDFLVTEDFVEAFLEVAGIYLSRLGRVERLGEKVMKDLKRKSNDR